MSKRYEVLAERYGELLGNVQFTNKNFLERSERYMNENLELRNQHINDVKRIAALEAQIDIYKKLLTNTIKDRNSNTDIVIDGILFKMVSSEIKLEYGQPIELTADFIKTGMLDTNEKEK